MICNNTISDGFNFMFGKFLFDLSVFGVSVLVVVAFYGWLLWATRRNKK